MEIKDIKLIINIPEGMGIDLENCNLKAGVIRFKKKGLLTYGDIVDSLDIDTFLHPISVHNTQKIKAIDKLMNIARFYNGDWKPDWSNINEKKFCIFYYNRDKIYTVDYNITFSSNMAYFKHKEDAQEVIDNPNFRDILDTIFKN